MRCSQVRSPANTLAMKAPMGLASARITSEVEENLENPVCGHVESLRAEQRVDEIQRERDCDHQ